MFQGRCWIQTWQSSDHCITPVNIAFLVWVRSYKEGLFCWSENGETQSQSCIEVCEVLRLTIQLAFTTYTSTLV